MKILFINLPYYGHVVPTIGLVQELIKKGCEVTYLLPFDWEEIITESGAKYHGYKNHRQLAEQMKNAYTAAEKIIEQFDLVIYEQFFFLGKHLSKKYKKPVVRVFTAPVTNKELMDEFICSKGPLSIFQHQWIAKAFTKDVAGNIPMKTDNWLDEIIYNPPELNLVYTLREYQPYENVDVIISVGHKFDVRKLKNIPSNVHIYNSVPQLQVLTMADVFVTHGGMNSISEALTFGTSMVVIPFVSDQPVNARYMEKLGVGKVLNYSEVNRDVLKNTIFSVMGDKEIENQLENVQRLIENAPGNQGGAEIVIDYYQKCAEEREMLV